MRAGSTPPWARVHLDDEGPLISAFWLWLLMFYFSTDPPLCWGPEYTCTLCTPTPLIEGCILLFRLNYDLAMLLSIFFHSVHYILFLWFLNISLGGIHSEICLQPPSFNFCSFCPLQFHKLDTTSKLQEVVNEIALRLKRMPQLEKRKSCLLSKILNNNATSKAHRTDRDSDIVPEDEMLPPCMLVMGPI